MRIPESPPDPAQFFQSIFASPDRLRAFFARRHGAEVDGEYLHWDELRHREPPDGMTRQEWWLELFQARNHLWGELPLKDKHGRAFGFSRSDGVLRGLHELDREFGARRVEMADPHLASRETRDRYLIRSLIEEAITSSQLEGASTTRKVAKEMLLSGRRPRNRDERMIVNNLRAMEFLRGKTKEPLSRALLLELHEMLAEGTLGPNEAGRFRRSDEHVSVRDLGDGQVLHVPPDASELPARVDALCKFANEESEGAFLHPVVRAIVLHFALAYDHPFTDGNGRTARGLFYWSMLRQDYWLAEFLSISRVIQRAPGQYSRAFLHCENGPSDVTYFILHQLGVIRRANEDLRLYLESKARELRETEQLMKDAEAFNHRQRALLAHALRHSRARYSIEGFRREHGVVYMTARRDLLDLADAGYLRKRKIGRAFYFDVPPDLERRLRSRRR
ncbi:MAG: Fic family protein [Myxococcales bacterium]|nr:Fic family protein [Myxococcales bacterium]